MLLHAGACNVELSISFSCFGVSVCVLWCCDCRSVHSSVFRCLQAGCGCRNLESGHLLLPFLIKGLRLGFVHVLEVLVELFLSGFPVLLPLDDVSSVLDVMADGHLLQSTLRVPQRLLGLLYSSRSAACLRRGCEHFCRLISYF